jgi:glyoxylase-like metal-dependent hydrolase (beta-lactamase superfamily II)
MDNLVYVLEDSDSGVAAVIDPAWDAPAILHLLARRGLTLTDILITHGHDDHVNALAPLLAVWPAAAVHASAEEAAFWRQATGGSVDVRPPEDRLSEVWAAPPPARLETHHTEDVIHIGGAAIRLIACPGHSPGGLCYRVGDDLFTGDTLFVYGCGRCDLPGSDARRMFQSLQRLKQRIPDEVLIRPGHWYAPEVATSMAEQRRGNPFLHIDDENDFVAFRAEHNRHRLPPYGPVPRGTPAWPSAQRNRARV